MRIASPRRQRRQRPHANLLRKWSGASAGDWCERGESNPHAFRHEILSLACLPFPPLSPPERGGHDRTGHCAPRSAGDSTGFPMGRQRDAMRPAASARCPSPALSSRGAAPPISFPDGPGRCPPPPGRNHDRDDRPIPCPPGRRPAGGLRGERLLPDRVSFLEDFETIPANAAPLDRALGTRPACSLRRQGFICPPSRRMAISHGPARPVRCARGRDAHVFRFDERSERPCPCWISSHSRARRPS
jgi:hypothetical protein